TLLGGGGSFSTGGPGKGMHSRLYLNVLNQNPNVESCMAFNTQYSDSGLFGMYITGYGQEAPRLVDIALNELHKLNSFTPEEVSRAKNTLKGNIFMNAENSKVLMEDIGRQIIMSGKVVTPEEFAARVDAVTEADLKEVAAKLLKKNPTYVVYGDTKSAPHYEYVRTGLAGSPVKGKRGARMGRDCKILDRLQQSEKCRFPKELTPSATRPIVRGRHRVKRAAPMMLYYGLTVVAAASLGCNVADRSFLRALDRSYMMLELLECRLGEAPLFQEVSTSMPYWSEVFNQGLREIHQ
ncbi:Mitochondrial-processing peptidase subunit alpha, partial [Perkinsus olseni]